VLVNELRAAVGQDPIGDADEDSADYFGVQPEWFDPQLVVAVLRDDALDPDVMPINPLLRAVKDLDDGQIVELVTSHLPAPGIDILRRKGYSTWTTEDDQTIRTYVLKEPAG
jgi:hypothetical protein